MTIEWTADPARGVAGDAAVRPEDVHVRLPVDWDSVDPIPDALAELMAPARLGRRAARRRRARASRSTRPLREVPRVIDLTGKAAARHRRLARDRPGDRAAARRPRAPTSRSATAATRRPRRRRPAAIEALGRRALAVQADVTDPEAAEALVKAALEAFGKVDILVNNAGITRDDLIMRMSVEALREVLETNLFGAFYMTKAVTRPMLKARGGRIINITSVSGQAGQTGQANYSSAKAGLIGLTKATARELASRGDHLQRRRARASS